MLATSISQLGALIFVPLLASRPGEADVESSSKHTLLVVPEFAAAAVAPARRFKEFMPVNELNKVGIAYVAVPVRLPLLLKEKDAVGPDQLISDVK